MTSSRDVEVNEKKTSKNSLEEVGRNMVKNKPINKKAQRSAAKGRSTPSSCWLLSCMPSAADERHTLKDKLVGK